MLTHLYRWESRGQQSRILDPEGHTDSYVRIAKVRKTWKPWERGRGRQEDVLPEQVTLVLSLKGEEESSRLKRRKENPDREKTLFQGPQ